MMKRLIALLAALMLLSCTAFAQEGVLRKAGEVSGDNDAMKHFQHLLDDHAEAFTMNASLEMISYDSLNDMILALRRGDIVVAGCARNNAEYIAARNADLMVREDDGMAVDIAYSMVTLEKQAQLYEALNNAIKEMKNDGSMDALIAKEITAYTQGQEDPQPVAMPVHEGAPTYRVAVSGDIPPMDFVLPDGQAAGFNVALLSEISNRIKVNFEIVSVSAPARMTALSAERVDVVFWTNASYCAEHDFSAALEVEGTLITEPYFLDDEARLVLAR